MGERVGVRGQKPDIKAPLTPATPALSPKTFAFTEFANETIQSQMFRGRGGRTVTISDLLVYLPWDQIWNSYVIRVS